MNRPSRRFAFRLCLELGYPHPDVLLSQITSRQFGEWMAYYNVEPFGDNRADLRSGILASVFANIYRKKGAKQYTPADFMPKFGCPYATRTKERRTSKQMPDPQLLREQTIKTMTALVDIQNKKGN